MGEKTQKIQQYKIDAVNFIKKDIQSVQNIIFNDFRGLNVGRITELRKKLSQQDCVLKVVKNNYAKIALSDLNYLDVKEMLVGPTALIYINGDIGQVAKILIEFEKNEALNIKGGIIDGLIFSSDDINRLSKLPGRDQLIGMVMSAMTAPLKNMMYVMQGIAQKLVRTLQAIADKKKGE